MRAGAIVSCAVGAFKDAGESPHAVPHDQTARLPVKKKRYTRRNTIALTSAAPARSGAPRRRRSIPRAWPGVLTEAAGGATGTGVSHAGARAKAAAMVELAELRLRNLAPRAVSELESLVTSRMPQLLSTLRLFGRNATSEAVRLAAARDLVDRSVGRATERIQVAAAITVRRPW